MSTPLIAVVVVQGPLPKRVKARQTFFLMFTNRRFINRVLSPYDPEAGFPWTPLATN